MGRNICAWMMILLAVFLALVVPGYLQKPKPSQSGTSADESLISMHLSWEELHTLSDHLVEISILKCPTLDESRMRLLKTFLSDFFKQSPFPKVNRPKFPHHMRQLDQCETELRANKTTRATPVKVKRSLITPLANDLASSATINLREIQKATSGLKIKAQQSNSERFQYFYQPKGIPGSGWMDTSNVFQDFVQNSRHKRDQTEQGRIRGSPGPLMGIPKDGFDYIKQAHHNFEAIIFKMDEIAKEACQLKVFMHILGLAEKEMVYWIHKSNADLFYLAQYFFSHHDILRLARKCLHP